MFKYFCQIVKGRSLSSILKSSALFSLSSERRYRLADGREFFAVQLACLPRELFQHLARLIRDEGGIYVSEPRKQWFIPCDKVDHIASLAATDSTLSAFKREDPAAQLAQLLKSEL